MYLISLCDVTLWSSMSYFYLSVENVCVIIFVPAEWRMLDAAVLLLAVRLSPDDTRNTKVNVTSRQGFAWLQVTHDKPSEDSSINVWSVASLITYVEKSELLLRCLLSLRSEEYFGHRWNMKLATYCGRWVTMTQNGCNKAWWVKQSRQLIEWQEERSYFIQRLMWSTDDLTLQSSSVLVRGIGFKDVI